MSRRICVIGLPRSGSQHVANLISINSDMTNLLEPFTKHPHSIDIPDDLMLYSRREDNYESTYDIQKTLRILKSGNINQSIVLKLFPYYYLLDSIPEIIQTLKDLNFEFVILKRQNVEHHLLSYGVALETDKWNESENSIKTNTKITINRFDDIEWLYLEIQNLDNRLKDWKITGSTIYYENSNNDVMKLLNEKNIKPNTITLKQASSNPWDQVDNVEEVKHFFQKLYNTNYENYTNKTTPRCSN